MKENCESACEVDSEYFSCCSGKNPLYPSCNQNDNPFVFGNAI
jgi:hypothetical protein